MIKKYRINVKKSIKPTFAEGLVRAVTLLWPLTCEQKRELLDVKKEGEIQDIYVTVAHALADITRVMITIPASRQTHTHTHT